MAEAKFKPTGQSVDDFIEGLEPPERRTDARVLCDMMTRLSGETPTLWYPNIVGFGAYHYHYDSGHEGDSIRIGFSPRKPAHVFYLMGGTDRTDLLAKLGKHTTGRSCLYVRRLRDIDLAILETMITDAIATMDEKYPR